ncbi:hypothetical protein DCD74_04910 [Lysobacter oculi]|uniref:DUF5666 domain-containing protein n=1 Tax=Solilutibacter oculi TaxID=2698682 RepID=A0A344J512_9GAMM|nr:DUF5666 domain-containing protein [Lysobacter oculi]AXA84122.1 hypothetical protein DCD74_04910 [Lysobacter oculi]
MTRLRTSLSAVAALAAALSLSGCMSVGGLGGYPGGSGGYPGGQYPGQGYPPSQPGYGQAITGNVDGVDHANARFMLRSDGGYGSSGGRIEMYYDRNTVASYQGRQVAPNGLENGDRIRVEAVQSSGRWWARSIEVLQDVRGGGSPVYGNTLGGAVTYIDTRNQVINFTRGGYSGSNDRVRYDQYTVVEYRGQRYQVSQLERGDVIRIEGRAVGNGEYLAQRIIVDTSVRER